MSFEYLETIKQSPSKENKHRKLYELLYSIIAVCFIVWIIAFVQIKSLVVDEPVNENMKKSNVLSLEQRAQIIDTLKEATANSPALTTAQRVRIVDNMRKQSDVYRLTEEERLKIINDLKNKI